MNLFTDKIIFSFFTILLLFGGMYYLSIGCISEIKQSCFVVEPFNSKLISFIYENNDIYYDLYGKFIYNKKICFILLDNLLDNNQAIDEYKNFHIDGTYKILVKKNGKCLIDYSNLGYRNYSCVGVILLICGDIALFILLRLFCFQKSIKIFNERCDNDNNDINDINDSSDISDNDNNDDINTECSNTECNTECNTEFNSNV